MLEKVRNKDKMRGLGRRDEELYKRTDKHLGLAEEPRPRGSKMDEAVLSPEYDALKKMQDRVTRLRRGE